MSAPATKAFSPSPRSTIARVSSSRSSRSYSSSSSSSSCDESAFTGGWSSVTIATRPSCSTLTYSAIHLLLSRCHAESSIQPNDFTVQVLVLEDMLDQRGEVLGPAEALREGNLGRQALADVLSHRPEHRGVRRAGRDRDDADPLGGEIACEWQRHPGDTGLGGGVGRLPDLAVEGRVRGRVDDHAARALIVRLAFGDLRRREREDVEGAD